eukprot:scaffold44080_cov36-Tisochrysis_lutea.AAC.6
MGALLSREHELDQERFDLVAWPTDPQLQLRWLLDVSQWAPRDAEWDLLIGLLTDAERAEVRRLTAQLDQKRALVSRLMQRRATALALGVPYAQVEIRRSRGGKPFVSTVPPSMRRSVTRAPNFNFNVAHDAGLVVLVSDAALLIGVDVVAPFFLRPVPWAAAVEATAKSAGRIGHGANGGVGETDRDTSKEARSDYDRLQQMFANVMTPDEWDAINEASSRMMGQQTTRKSWAERAWAQGGASPSSDLGTSTYMSAVGVPAEVREEPNTCTRDNAAVTAFREQWSRKEAFVKARGDGLAFEMRRVEFCPSRPPRPSPEASMAQTSGVTEREDHASSTASDVQIEMDSAAIDSEDVSRNPSPDLNHQAAEHVAADSLPTAVSAFLLGSLIEEESPASFCRVYVDEELRDDWVCWTHEVCGGYIISIARGPVSDAQDSDGTFVRTLHKPELPPDELNARLSTPPMPFRMLNIIDLVPEHLRSSFLLAAQSNGPEWTGLARQAMGAGTPINQTRNDGVEHENGANASAQQIPEWIHPANIRKPVESDVDEGCVMT